MKKSTDSIPAYSVIFSDLRNLIVSGTLAPGDSLPSENELCSQYAVSRETVRKGLLQLANEGMIYSRPRCGYFVSHPKETFTLSPSEELQHSNMNFKEIKIIQPDQELCRRLRLTPENLVILITRVNSLGGETAGVEYKYMPYEKGSPSIEEEINYAVFPDPAIEKSYSFNYYTEVDVQAATARGEVLSLLRCEEHEPLLKISRLFITQDDQYIAYSKQYLRASCGILRGISGYVHKNGKNRKD